MIDYVFQIGDRVTYRRFAQVYVVSDVDPGFSIPAVKVDNLKNWYNASDFRLANSLENIEPTPSELVI